MIVLTTVCLVFLINCVLKTLFYSILFMTFPKMNDFGSALYQCELYVPTASNMNTTAYPSRILCMARLSDDRFRSLVLPSPSGSYEFHFRDVYLLELPLLQVKGWFGRVRNSLLLSFALRVRSRKPNNFP